MSLQVTEVKNEQNILWKDKKNLGENLETESRLTVTIQGKAENGKKEKSAQRVDGKSRGLFDQRG